MNESTNESWTPEGDGLLTVRIYGDIYIHFAVHILIHPEIFEPFDLASTYDMYNRHSHSSPSTKAYLLAYLSTVCPANELP